MCPAEEFLGKSPGLEGVTLIRDVVPLENSASAVSGDLHDHRFRHTRPPKKRYSLVRG